MQAEPLFPTEPAPQRDYINPRAVQCPTCGAGERGWCAIRRPRNLDPHAIWCGAAHPARVALARHLAGVADEPPPTLLDHA